MHNKNHDKLLMADHDEYGIWYFTNRKKIERVFGINQSLFDYYLKKAASKGDKYWKLDDWTFSWVENDGDIIYKFINPEKETIFG